MAEHIRHIRELRRNGDTIRSDEVVDEHNAETAHAQYTAVRVVWYIAGILLALLALRFLLAILGANQGNTFANFIYSVSYPFVAPFFGLFSYRLQYGVSRFETYTLVAMAVYALIAWGIARLITINRPSDEVEH